MGVAVGPEIQALAQAMRNLRLPMGLGMKPSAFDVNRGRGLAMAVALLLMGFMGLVLPTAAPDDRRVYRVYRTTAWLLCAANLAMLGLWWV